MAGSSQISIISIIVLVIPLSIPLNNQHQMSNRKNTERDSSLLHNKNALSINSTHIKCKTKKSIRKCIMCSTTIAQGKTLYPNANVHKNTRKIYARYYITFIPLRITESIANARTFSSCNFTDSYDLTHEGVFAPAYLSGYPIQVTL